MSSPIQVHIGNFGDNISGATVARTIDLQLTPAIWSYDRDLQIQPASCPAQLDLAGGRIAHCTLPIGGFGLPVVVKSGKDYGSFFVTLDGVLFPMPKTERLLEAEVARSYDMHAVVHCGEPRLRLLAVGTQVRCALAGRGLPKSIKFKVVNARGQVFVYDLAHQKSQNTILLAHYLSLHKARRSTVMPGTTLERMVREAALGLGPEFRPDRRTLLRGLRVHCPLRSDLSGDHQVTCVATVASGTMRYGSWIDRGGNFHILARNTLAQTAWIASDAESYYERKLEAGGFRRRVNVDCGANRVTSIDRTTKLVCTGDAGEGKHRLTISFPDFPGSQEYYYWEP